jgi:iron complex outermembrane receptor protein
LEDTLYLGVNGQYNQDNGWIENDLPGMDDHANREKNRNTSAYLMYRRGERLELRLTASDDDARKYWINGYGQTAGIKLGAFNRDDAEHVSFDVDHVEKIESRAQGLHLTYAFDAVTMTSTTTHRNLDLENDYDGDYADNAVWSGLSGFLYSETETWTQELRVASSKTEGLRWVAGFYLDSEEFEKGPYGTQYPGMGVNYEMNAVSDSKNDTRAVFGQIMAPFGGGFELTLGGRYQRFETEMDMDMYYLPMGMTGPAYFDYQGDESWTTFLPRAALSYEINDAWNAYANWARGYMPGGFNFFATSGTSEDNKFEPQQSSNYEIGIKGDYDRLRLAASLFYMDIEDIHVYKSMGAGVYLTDNADSAHSLGAELEMTCFPTNTTELTMALGVIDAEYDDYDAGGGVRFDDEKIQETPAHTARIGFAYFHPLGFYTRADVRSQGHTYYFDDANKIFGKEGGFVVADMKIGYRLRGLDVYAYGKNLTDEAYVESFKSSSLVSLATFGDPRAFGVGLRYAF